MTDPDRPTRLAMQARPPRDTPDPIVDAVPRRAALPPGAVVSRPNLTRSGVPVRYVGTDAEEAARVDRAAVRADERRAASRAAVLRETEEREAEEARRRDAYAASLARRRARENGTA